MLKLGNDNANQQLKIDVTPAEVLVLEVIHGAGSVSKIQLKGLDSNGKDANRRSHRQELARLRAIYSGNPGSNGDLTGDLIGGTPFENDPTQQSVIDRLFPGINPSLPLKYSDLNGHQEEESDDVKQEEAEAVEDPTPKPVKRSRPILRDVETVSS